MPETPEQIPKFENGINPISSLYTGMTEQTYFKSPLVSDSYRPPYNPDDLWQLKGDYSIYEEMLNDDQVSVCLQLKKDLVIGEGAIFVPSETGQDEIIDDLNRIFFETYEGDFLEDIEEILTNYEFGFSITEKVFKKINNSKLGLKYLKTRHPNSFKLFQDDHGNVVKYEQNTSRGLLEVNPDSIIHAINTKRFQNPYGTSDLRPAYNAWFTKTQIVRYFGMFLEKAASPVPIGRYDKNAPQSAIDKIFESLKRFQTKTALVIPKEIEVEFLEANNTGEAYSKAIHLFNMFIGRSLFIPDLLGFTGSETGGGSLALGEKQLNLFFMHIARRRNSLENIINKELVRTLVLYNYGDIKNPPKFKFKPLDDMKAVDLAKTWLEAVKGKAYQPNEEEINHFRKLVKFPEGKVEFASQVISSIPKETTPNGDNDEKENDGVNEEKTQDSEIEESEEAENNSENNTNEYEKETDTKTFSKIYDMPSGAYYKKVDFKKIANKLNDYDQSIMDDSRSVVKKMLSDLSDQIEKKNILKSGDATRMDSLSLKYKKELKQILKASFTQLFRDSQSQAANELEKGLYAKPVTSQEFLDLIEQESYQFVGDYEYTILKRVKSELVSAIKDGRPLSSVLDILSDDLQKLSDVQLERYARTKHTEVMNNARVEYFDSTEVVVAYQYSAALDDRTSDICSGLHGKIFEKGSEPIPPMHFNCRSLLIPITKYEEYKPTETIRGQSVSDFIEENKGKGFSTKWQQQKIA